MSRYSTVEILEYLGYEVYKPICLYFIKADADEALVNLLNAFLPSEW